MHLSICGSSYLMGESILLLMTGLSVASWSCAAVIEVSCLILNLDSVECTWRGQVNYTFYSRYKSDQYRECSSYVLEQGLVIGCSEAYLDIRDRFKSFSTNLTHENCSTVKIHDLKARVKMNPPTNLTVKNIDGHELWLYWNNSRNYHCLESEVWHKNNNSEWKSFNCDNGKHDFSVPLPSQSLRYVFQVRTRVSDTCYESKFWSEWSQAISWGPIIVPNLKVKGLPGVAVTVWTPLLAVMAALTLLLLVMLLLHNERLKVILVPMVPNPAKNPILAELLDTHNGNVEEWLHISKELKEGFKPNFSERACSVREYTTQSANQSESSAPITIDQSDCSVSISTDQSNCLSNSGSSSTSTSSLPITSGEEQAGL
ncbi:cytokine receptor common subunit gamma-like isoform X2 [Hypomesus transpacificus]|uniref:cytokine receptor common subunit gamma-like isoform X2 n=1 Tax=Hypomesus transpacificus TaxID=137520 RepID=UPI001F076372|nr:cytokine receptor common subunit gamma-like isoform X2 [Hypomesus transpacificus]